MQETWTLLPQPNLERKTTARVQKKKQGFYNINSWVCCIGSDNTNAWGHIATKVEKKHLTSS